MGNSGKRYWLLAVSLVLWVVILGGCTTYAVPASEYGRPVDALKGKQAAESEGLTVDFSEGEMRGGDKARFGVEVPRLKAPDVEPANGAAETGRGERLVIYNGAVYVVVDRIEDSIRRIREIVEGMGGYMQEMTARSITLKVPAEKFRVAIEEAGKLGEVTKKEVKGSDVTEEMRDLTIRLQNAEQMRQRLLAILAKAEKVEDILKIEKELGRVIETIELYKGKIAYLKNKIAFSTLTVHFNSPVPQNDVIAQTPFRWVHELGDGMTRGEGDYPFVERSFWSQLEIELPEGYLKYYENKLRVRAMSAAGVRIDLHKEENYSGGSLAFWGALVRRVLLEQKTILIKDELNPMLKKDIPSIILTGSKRIGSKEYGYLTGLAVSKKHVYVFEAWGPLDEFEKDRDKLEAAFGTLQVR